MIDVPFAYALTLGMVATFNPCGFAMLPAYLAYFAGVDATHTENGGGARGGVARALLVGATVSAGFLLTFGALGLVVSHLTSAVYRWAPWFTVVIGAVLVVAGVGLLAGWKPAVRLPRVEVGGRTRGVGSMVLFGVSYAVVSTGCSLVFFVPAIAAMLRDASLVSGLVAFLTFGVGMGLVISALTVALALARHSLVQNLRDMVRYVNRVAGALLVVAGAYVGYYGTLEIRQGSGTSSGAFAERIWNWSGRAQQWITDVGATRLGVVLAVVVAGAAAYVVLGKRLAHAGEPSPGLPTDEPERSGSRHA